MYNIYSHVLLGSAVLGSAVLIGKIDTELNMD